MATIREWKMTKDQRRYWAAKLRDLCVMCNGPREESQQNKTRCVSCAEKDAMRAAKRKARLSAEELEAFIARNRGYAAISRRRRKASRSRMVQDST